MNTMVYKQNIAGLGELERLADHATAVAAGSGDATTVTGITINREGFNNGGLALSAAMGVAYEATLASGKTLSFAYAVQDSADSTNFSDFQTGASTVAATGPSGGGVVKGCTNVPVNLTGARQYIRFNYQPDLSATGTDTMYGDAVGFFGGWDRLPPPTN